MAIYYNYLTNSAVVINLLKTNNMEKDMKRIFNIDKVISEIIATTPVNCSDPNDLAECLSKKLPTYIKAKKITIEDALFGMFNRGTYYGK